MIKISAIIISPAWAFRVLCLLLCWSWANITVASSSAVVSAHPLATQAGETILSQGGNAFDAAVAISATLAVVEPYSSGLGGGGFWLLHRVRDKYDVMIDGRETAPGKASSGMYLDTDNNLIRGASLNGPLAAAIPGMPAALVHITKKYGRLSLEQNITPAIKLARDGFIIDSRFSQTIKNHHKKLLRNQMTAQIFLDKGNVPTRQTLLRQPQLATTLTAIAKHGMSGFYSGRIAQELIQSVQQAGGIWEYEDLAHYRIIERQPIRFTYRGTNITSASLPSAGGLTLAQGLNILEYFPMPQLSKWEQMHLIAESLRFAYQDRTEFLGDSDFVRIPKKRLLSKEYARKRAATISMDQAGSSLANSATSKEGTETTHFSVIDKMGNRIAATMSINTYFGSGFIAGNTGVLLNNEMDDFSMGDNVPNIFGLYGKKVNAIAPEKRPLSSMSPTFIENERGILIVGTPGGSRIISMLLLTIIDYVDHKQANATKLVSRPRLHHQYLPDQIELEPDSFDQNTIDKLRLKGHKIRLTTRKWGNMQLIFFDKKNQQAHVASDPRGSSNTRY